ncbi:MAG: carbohydrate ABC transporter permease [Actinobacteria bacterium]|nr:carbohydrate ABC transporter permease [Actinomycetota bacterium]
MLITKEEKTFRIITYVLLIFGVVITLLPFLYMISVSFKSQIYTFEYPPRLIPRNPTLENYINALSKDLFGRNFLNSLFVATATTISTVFISALMAYAFSRMQFPGKEVLFYILLLGMMIPPVMLIIPQFIIAKYLHLLNSLWGLIVVYVAVTLSMQTFLLRSFFETIPRELEEAVLVDGGSNWVIFTKVILPLSKPGLSVVAIFTFLYAWDEFPWAHVAIRESSRRTLPVAIALFQNQYLTQWGLVFAATTVASIPVIIVFIIFQRYFIQGFVTTGLRR